MSQRESRLSRQIQKALKDEFGRDLFIFKVHGGPLMMAGLPDLIGCYRGLFFALETKMPGGTVSVIQQHVHTKLRRAGARIDVPQSVADALNMCHAWFD
jgi:hypothetical protein